MAIQDLQIRASIAANNPAAGEDHARYCRRILDYLEAQYPAEAAYIRARLADLLRRISVITDRMRGAADRAARAAAGAPPDIAAIADRNAAQRAIENALRKENDQRNAAALAARRAAAYAPAAAAASAAAAAAGPDLNEQFGIRQQADERAAIAAVMGIRDAGHAYHQGNFDANQTRRQLIDNLFATVPAAQQDAVAQRVIQRYGYDPR